MAQLSRVQHCSDSELDLWKTVKLNLFVCVVKPRFTAVPLDAFFRFWDILQRQCQITGDSQCLSQSTGHWQGCWGRSARGLMVISGLPSYHWTPLPLTGTSQTTPAWKSTTKTQPRLSAMHPDLPTAMPGWVLPEPSTATSETVFKTVVYLHGK